jgi:hypothetical protein
MTSPPRQVAYAGVNRPDILQRQGMHVSPVVVPISSRFSLHTHSRQVQPAARAFDSARARGIGHCCISRARRRGPRRRGQGAALSIRAHPYREQCNVSFLVIQIYGADSIDYAQLDLFTPSQLARWPPYYPALINAADQDARGSLCITGRAGRTPRDSQARRSRSAVTPLTRGRCARWSTAAATLNTAPRRRPAPRPAPRSTCGAAAARAARRAASDGRESHAGRSDGPGRASGAGRKTERSTRAARGRSPGGGDARQAAGGDGEGGRGAAREYGK